MNIQRHNFLKEEFSLLYDTVRYSSQRTFFCPALAPLVSPVPNIIFLTVHFFNLFVPIAQEPRQAGVLGRLSLCLWVHRWYNTEKRRKKERMRTYS